MIVLGDKQEFVLPNTELITAVALREEKPLDYRPGDEMVGFIDIYVVGSNQAIIHLSCSTYKKAQKTYSDIIDIIEKERKERYHRDFPEQNYPKQTKKE